MREWIVDAALAALTAVAVLTGTTLAGQPVTLGGTVPLAGLLGGALLVRRRWPIAVLVGSVAAIIGYGTTDLDTPGWAWPVSVAYASAVLAGHTRWAVGTGVVTLAFAATWTRDLGRIGAETLWLATVLAGTLAYLGWRRVTELDARGRVAVERLRIARELHDVVAHTLAVVGIHLNVAADAVDENQPDEARDALRLAQSVRGQAMADLATLIGILRDPTGPHGANDLVALANQARATGLDVRLDGHTTDLPTPVALAAYRVVQESLTNVLKHADANRVTVHIEHGPAEVTVTVTDNGTGGSGVTQNAAGHGIAGMRERILALGGTLDTGPVASGGFAVRAQIPVPGSAT